MPRKKKVTAKTATKSTKKRKTSEVEEVKAPPKPVEWLRTGHCAEAHRHANPVKAHQSCPHKMETPTSTTVCPCPCHVPGVLELLSEFYATLATVRKIPTAATIPGSDGKCPTCGEAGRKVKKEGVPLWKCENKHRWPRISPSEAQEAPDLTPVSAGSPSSERASKGLTGPRKGKRERTPPNKRGSRAAK